MLMFYYKYKDNNMKPKSKVTKQSKKEKILTTVVNNLKNYVVIILDKSGSMDKIKHEVVGGFNQNIEAIKKSNTETGMETKVCLVTFSSFVKTNTFCPCIKAWADKLAHVVDFPSPVSAAISMILRAK